MASQALSLFDFDWSNNAPPQQKTKVTVNKIGEYDKIPEGGMTFEEIGEALGVSRQRAQTIYKQAMRKIKNLMKNSHNGYFSNMIY